MKRLSCLKIQRLKKLWYAEHICNSRGIFRGFDIGTYSQLLVEWGHPQYIGFPIIFCRNSEPELNPKIHLPFPIAGPLLSPGTSLASALVILAPILQAGYLTWTMPPGLINIVPGFCSSLWWLISALLWGCSSSKFLRISQRQWKK